MNTCIWCNEKLVQYLKNGIPNFNIDYLVDVDYEKWMYCIKCNKLEHQFIIREINLIYDVYIIIKKNLCIYGVKLGGKYDCIYLVLDLNKEGLIINWNYLMNSGGEPKQQLFNSLEEIKVELSRLGKILCFM